LQKIRILFHTLPFCALVEENCLDVTLGTYLTSWWIFPCTENQILNHSTVCSCSMNLEPNVENCEFLCLEIEIALALIFTKDLVKISCKQRKVPHLKSEFINLSCLSKYAGAYAVNAVFVSSLFCNSGSTDINRPIEVMSCCFIYVGVMGVKGVITYWETYV
jgi:hypothetical protein